MGCDEARLLLDAFVDGELSAGQEEELLAHVHACEACRAEFEAAKLLRDCLKDMDEDVAVPLEAQAAWRRAVRAEAKKKLSRKWTKFAGAVAAALVVVLGVGFFMGGEAPVSQPAPEAAVIGLKNAELIAADGEAQNVTSGSGDSGFAARRKYAVADVQAAGKTIEMLAAEYSGVFILDGEEDSMRCRVELPRDYMEDFLNAVSCVGTELVSETAAAEGDTAVIQIQIDPA